MKNFSLDIICFLDDEKVKEFFLNGLKNEKTHEVCLAVLYVSTSENQYLEQILLDDDTLSYMALHYLDYHGNNSENISKLLTLNQERREKKDREYFIQKSISKTIYNTCLRIKL